MCREERAAKEKKEWFEKDSYVCDHTHTITCVLYAAGAECVLYVPYLDTGLVAKIRIFAMVSQC